MRRNTLVVLALIVAAIVGGCKKDPPILDPGDEQRPPLPPASGTAVGYLIDSATELALREDQLTKLKEIDQSLAARNDVIDTQLRAIEIPDEEPAEKGQPPPRHNNAPGAQVKTTPDAAKLHEAKKQNDREALERAFAVLDADQQTRARKLLEDRGITVPERAERPSPEAPSP